MYNYDDVYFAIKELSSSKISSIEELNLMLLALPSKTWKSSGDIVAWFSKLSIVVRRVSDDIDIVF